jgi:hypothetical protein
LDNAEGRAAEAPRSFFIPPAELRHSLKVGDEVKLIFCLDRGDGEAAVERMWVELSCGTFRRRPTYGWVSTTSLRRQSAVRR